MELYIGGYTLRGKKPVVREFDSEVDRECWPLSPFTGETRQAITAAKHFAEAEAIRFGVAMPTFTELDLFVMSKDESTGQKRLSSKIRKLKNEVVLITEGYTAAKTNVDTYIVHAVFADKYYNGKDQVWEPFGPWVANTATHVSYKEAWDMIRTGKFTRGVEE